jgi:hypothetical protein
LQALSRIRHHSASSTRTWFGKALQVQYVGFPVVENQSSLAFELYESARIEGKGEEMVQALFDMLQDDHQAITEPDVQEMIFQ